MLKVILPYLSILPKSSGLDCNKRDHFKLERRYICCLDKYNAHLELARVKTFSPMRLLDDEFYYKFVKQSIIWRKAN